MLNTPGSLLALAARKQRQAVPDRRGQDAYLPPARSVRAGEAPAPMMRGHRVVGGGALQRRHRRSAIHRDLWPDASGELKVALEDRWPVGERPITPHIARLGRSAGLAAGHGGGGDGPARARVSAWRSASGSRCRPTMRRTRSAASAAGIPAAVTNSGRPEAPRTTGIAWVAVRNRDLTTPITGMPNSACAWVPRPGWPRGSRSA